VIDLPELLAGLQLENDPKTADAQHVAGFDEALTDPLAVVERAVRTLVVNHGETRPKPGESCVQRTNGARRQTHVAVRVAPHKEPGADHFEVAGRITLRQHSEAAARLILDPHQDRLRDYALLRLPFLLHSRLFDRPD
jgi:hypothetical protein